MKEGSAEKFANHESIKRLAKQLERATDEAQRKTIVALLAEEEAKAKQLADDWDPDPDDKAKQGH